LAETGAIRNPTVWPPSNPTANPSMPRGDILALLRDINECAETIAEYTTGLDEAAFLADRLYSYTSSLNSSDMRISASSTRSRHLGSAVP